MMEAGKFLPRRMQAEGEADASLMKHGIEDLEDQPHEPVDDVIPVGDQENMAPHARDDLGARGDLIEREARENEG